MSAARRNGKGARAAAVRTDRHTPGLLLWLSLAAAITLIDQASKVIVERSLQYAERVPVLPFFDITLVYNPGAAFSFLAGASGWQRWFFTGLGSVVAAGIVWMLARHGQERLFATALTLILGGAVGNVIDRLVHGHVIDFALLYVGQWSWPAFNVADSAIVVGAVLLVVDELLRVRRSRG